MADSLDRRIGAWARRQVARSLADRHLDLTVSGLGYLPPRGPGIIVARHYHHLYDAAALLAIVPREVHVLIALDWLRAGWQLEGMRWLARVAQWPAVRRPSARAPDGRDTWRVNATALADSVALLRAGQLLLVFPEGYPVVDPAGGRQPGAAAILPFQSGFVTVAVRAEQGGHRPVPIVPAGSWYQPLGPGRWRVALRFGSPVWVRSRAERTAVVETVQRAVSALSCPPGLRSPALP